MPEKTLEFKDVLKILQGIDEQYSILYKYLSGSQDMFSDNEASTIKCDALIAENRVEEYFAKHKDHLKTCDACHELIDIRVENYSSPFEDEFYCKDCNDSYRARIEQNESLKYWSVI